MPAAPDTVPALPATTLPPPARAQAGLAARVETLDGWRGLAILLVLQSHFLPWQRYESGRLGVDLFFCLSGLLMSNLLFVRRTPLAQFYKRRISRILPAFVVFVGLMYALAAWREGQWRPWQEIASSLFFLRTYLPAQPDIWHTGLPIGHLWSLNVEEHSYVFLSLLTLLAFLRGREFIVLAVVTLATSAFFIFYARTPQWLHTSFEVRTEVAAGVLMASAGYFLVRERVAPFVQPWMPLAALALASTAYVFHAPYLLEAVMAPLALAFAVNHIDQAPGWWQEMLASRPLRQVGIWSFSLYLWQQPFYEWAPAIGLPLGLAGALLAGLASFYLLENPCREWINRRWQ